MSLAVSTAPSPLRSSTMTRQPSPASVRQSCRPRLRAPPVTSATFPAIPRSTASPRLPRSARTPSCIRSPRLRLRLALLFAFEVGGSLLEEGLEALRRVLGADDLVEGADLHLDGGVDVRL